MNIRLTKVLAFRENSVAKIKGIIAMVISLQSWASSKEKDIATEALSKDLLSATEDLSLAMMGVTGMHAVKRTRSEVIEPSAYSAPSKDPMRDLAEISRELLKMSSSFGIVNDSVIPNKAVRMPVDAPELLKSAQGAVAKAMDVMSVLMAGPAQPVETRPKEIEAAPESDITATAEGEVAAQAENDVAAGIEEGVTFGHDDDQLPL